MPIAGHQGISFLLADMAMHLELSRLITYRAANDVDRGVRSSYFASIAKCFAADTAMQTAVNAVQVMVLSRVVAMNNYVYSGNWIIFCQNFDCKCEFVKQRISVIFS